MHKCSDVHLYSSPFSLLLDPLIPLRLHLLLPEILFGVPHSSLPDEVKAHVHVLREAHVGVGLHVVYVEVGHQARHLDSNDHEGH